VTEGQTVQEGDGLLVLEAMKMENELRAPTAGVVQAVHVATDEAVDKDALLIEIDTGDV
jgi:pyruvate carboxylase subunit B